MQWYSLVGAACVACLVLGCSGEDGESSSTSSAVQSSSSVVSAQSTSALSSSAATSSASSAATDIYAEIIEPDMIQARCVACHVASGPSANTRLVFTAGADQTDPNRTVVLNFIALQNDADEILLDKVRGGLGHGGGAVFASSTVEYSALAEFLGQSGNSGNGGLDGNAALAKLTLEDQQKTLRRATLLFAGRLPTDAELSQVAANPAGLATQIRAAMEGDGFHDFLIRGANDRLHTDAFVNGLNLDVMNPARPFYPVLADRLVQVAGDDTARKAFNQWKNRLSFGVARAPVELIAHIAENDLPYSQVLTADYTMVNPESAEVYNADVSFADGTDATEFLPALNRGQILNDDALDTEYVQGVGRVIYSHGDFVQYPHAGILAEPAFLNRYPSTDTNRNRARARWTYYHFLDVDIEKSAPRTNDPEALADTNNPTMNNPNCTVCHQVMDPVAGAFQNFGDEGTYRDANGGLDSLPRTYTRAKDTPYVAGDTWYRDMRTPGFDGKTVASNQDSLQWLAQQIVNDPRFARATVKFWWPAVMAEPVRNAPENDQDADYQAQLVGFEAQEALIDELAVDFVKKNLNLKDLLVDMAMSSWFRAEGANSTLSTEEKVLLQSVGKSRLLTPEELEAKTRSLLGFAWGERFDASWTIDGHWSQLQNPLRIYYGGIDSQGITERATVINSLMTNVALNQALSVSCPAVLFDFNRESGQQRLFKFVDRNTTPADAAGEAAIRQQLQYLHQQLLGEWLATDDPEINASYELLVSLWQERQARGFPKSAVAWSYESCEVGISGWWDQDRGAEFADPNYMQGTWMSMMVYFLTDYHYLHE